MTSWLAWGAGGLGGLCLATWLVRLRAALASRAQARAALEALRLAGDEDGVCVAEQRLRDRELTVARRRRWWRLGA